MDKQAAGRVADAHLAQWRDAATYSALAWADDNQSVSATTSTADGVSFDVTSTVWREEHDSVYVMQVRVTEVGRKRLFGGAVTRYGRMFPDGRFESGL